MAKKTAHLIGAGSGAEAAALDVDGLVVRPLVGGDGVDGGGGAGGGDESEGLLAAGVALRRGDALGDGPGAAARTWRRGEAASSVTLSDLNFDSRHSARLPAGTIRA